MTLVVTDPQGASSEESQVTVTRTPLSAVASVLAEVVEAVSAEGTEVALDGSGSEYPEGAVVHWLDNGVGIAEVISPTVLLGLGEHELIIEITVGEVVDTDTVTVEITDTTSPLIADGLGDFEFEVSGEVSEVQQSDVLAAVLERAQPLVSDTVDAAPEISLLDAPGTFPIGTTVLSLSLIHI